MLIIIVNAREQKLHESGQIRLGLSNQAERGEISAFDALRLTQFCSGQLHDFLFRGS